MVAFYEAHIIATRFRKSQYFLSVPCQCIIEFAAVNTATEQHLLKLQYGTAGYAYCNVIIYDPQFSFSNTKQNQEMIDMNAVIWLMNGKQTIQKHVILSGHFNSNQSMQGLTSKV